MNLKDKLYCFNQISLGQLEGYLQKEKKADGNNFCLISLGFTSSLTDMVV